MAFFSLSGLSAFVSKYITVDNHTVLSVSPIIFTRSLDFVLGSIYTFWTKTGMNMSRIPIMSIRAYICWGN